MGVTIRQKNGKWYVFVNFQGKRKAKCVGTRKAAEEVKRKLEARLALGDLGFLADKQKVTFGEYAARWLTKYAKVECKPSTSEGYESILNLHLLPKFKNQRIDTISREQVKELVYAVAIDRSRNTVRNILRALNTILNHAVEDGVLETNPATKLGRFTKTDKAQVQPIALSRDESELFLESTRHVCPQYYPLFLMALRAGLRRGELIAMQWGDIQFGANEDDSNRYIMVQRNFVVGKFTTPKSKKSRRVDLSKQLRSVLLELRDRRLLEAFLKGKNNILDELIFPSEAGTVLDPKNLYNRYFLPAVERAGLRTFRMHDLRHTFGSLLIQDGASLAYVKDQMGHSSIQITVDIYGHLIPGANIACVDKLDPQPKKEEKQETSQQQSATPAQPDEKRYAPRSFQVTEKEWRALRDSNPRPSVPKTDKASSVQVAGSDEQSQDVVGNKPLTSSSQNTTPNPSNPNSANRGEVRQIPQPSRNQEGGKD